MTTDPTWRDQLDERMRKQVAFAELYTKDFGHGAVGHNDYILIARLALLLDVAAGVKELPRPPVGGELLITFGKYRDKTIGQIWLLDPGYVEWLAREGRDPDVRAAAQALRQAQEVPLLEPPATAESEADVGDDPLL